MEQDVSRIPGSKLEPVAALQLLPLDPLAVHKRPVLAPKVFNKEVMPILHDLGVIARDPRICDYQVFVHLASHSERSPVQNDILLFTSLHEDKGRKHSGAGAMTRTADGIQR